MSQTRIVLPKSARKGEVIEIKTLIQHAMETGHRRDNMGLAIPRHIIKSYHVTYAGEEVFRAELFPGVAANPYFSFTTTASISGDFIFTWEDDRGVVVTEKARLTVT